MKNPTRIFMMIYASLILLLLLFTPIDQHVSTFLYGDGTRDTRYMILSEITYIPAFFIGLFSGFYYHLRFKPVALKQRLTTVVWLGFTLLIMVLLFMMFYRSMRFLPGDARLYFTPPTFIIMSVIAYKFAEKALKKQLFQFDYLASIGLLMIGILYFVVNLLKRFVGRARFYMVFEDDSLFSHWFDIQPGLASSRDFYSIPSGHTSFAAISLWLIMVVLTVPSLKKYAKPTIVLVILWIIMQGFLRVFSGEHFATDAIFSILLVFTTMHFLFIVTRQIRTFLTKKYQI